MKKFYYRIVFRKDEKPIPAYRPFGSRRAAQINISIMAEIIAGQLGIATGTAKRYYISPLAKIKKFEVKGGSK